MSTRLILIRHGSTDWSIKKQYCSFTNIDLNNKGKNEAKKLYQRMNKEKIYKIYSSDNKRTLHFAKIAFRGRSIEKVPELREFNFGIFEGLTYNEIIKRYPEIYTSWLNNPFFVDIPGGENLNDYIKRVSKVLKKIISLNRKKTLAIVTHAGPIKIIIGEILKSKDIWKINVDLASLNIIDFKDGKGKIQLLNDTSYLPR